MRHANTPDGAKEPLAARDLAIGSAIALVLASTFAAFSPGRALLVTFVPGVVFAWTLLLGVKWRAEPRRANILPLYFATLALQVAHFIEEWALGFRERFPPLYGGVPFDTTTFVIFNLFAYVVFAIAAIAVFRKGRDALLIPVLFFIGYGAFGNSVAHITWTVVTGSYFPGVVTGLAHAVLGPLLLRRILGAWWVVAMFAIPFATALVTLLITGIE